MESLRVLIVSADADAANLFTVQLESSLECVSEWCDVASALQRLEKGERVDVVLLDIGREANWADCARLTGAPDARPVVVVTAWLAGDGRFRARTFASGAAAFVVKPCTGETLADAVRRVRSGERGLEYTARYAVDENEPTRSRSDAH
jgi:CheY-like chemotaxis protein